MFLSCLGVLAYTHFKMAEQKEEKRVKELQERAGRESVEEQEEHKDIKDLIPAMTTSWTEDDELNRHLLEDDEHKHNLKASS